MKDSIAYLKKYGNKDTLEEDLKKLESGIPVQYIVGHVDFYGYNFYVDKRVLIPRFETEELVYNVLKYSRKQNKSLKILDLGTGSGCIAITLKKELPNSSVTAVDISNDALAVAKMNSKKNEVEINFIHSDMLDKVEGEFDIIVSNPPYIADDEEIMDIVKNNEPNNALYAPNKGLYYYENILSNIYKYLNKQSLLAFEIGASQGERVLDLAHKYFPSAKTEIKKDIQKKDRIVLIYRS